MKSVMLSIKPKFCELIANGKKTVEVRKTRPKIETPFKCYIYETKGKIQVSNMLDKWVGGKVIGEFVCDETFDIQFYTKFLQENALIQDYEYHQYKGYGKNKTLYGWHISDLKIYDKPKELGEFFRNNMLSYDDWLYGIYNGKGGSTSSYESYKNIFKMKRPPQSWCYVEELK